ncbi:phage tail tape measure protein [Lysinibacillus sp. FSL R7-0073]|uniref:phage tail protein n=1 Tax=Lysinibacillus sp. FSL R7-0073 TaxID=2921669 RepID=UPI0030FAE3E9
MNLTAVFRVRDQGSSRLRQITQAMERMNRTSRNASDSMSRSQAAVNRFGSSVSSTSNRVGGFATRVSSLRVGADGVSASLRGMQGALVGLMGAYVGVTGASKLFSATIGAAANYEQNAMAITGMFGDDKQAKKYLQMVEKAAIDSPVLNSTDMMTNSKAFIGISKNLDELKQVWGLVERIQALSGVDTQQAAFSTKELMQGDYVSMYEAVGLDKKELQKITKMDGMSAKMAGLDKLLTKMGVNDEMVNNMANTTKGLWSQLEEKSQTFFRNIGMESNTKLADFLRRLNKMFDGIDTDALSNKLGGMLGKVTDKAIALYDIFVKWRTQIAYVAGAIGTFVAALAVVGTISALANPIALIAMGISAAAVGLKALYDNSETFRGAIEKVVTVVKDLWSVFQKGGVEGLISVLFPPDVAEKINGIITGIKSKISELMTAFNEGGFGGVFDKIFGEGSFESLKTKFEEVKSYITEKITQFQPAFEQLVDAFSTAWDTVSDILTSAWDIIGPILSGLWDWIQILGDIIMIVYNNVIAPAISFLAQLFSTLWSIAKPILELLGIAWEALSAIIKWAWDNVLAPLVEFILTGVKNALDGFSGALEIVQGWFETLSGWVSTAYGHVKDFIGFISNAKLPSWITNGISAGVDFVGNLIGAGGDKKGGKKSHYSGLDSVPYDGYSARLHKNEKVLTAQEAKAYDEGQGGTGGGVVITGNNFTVREEADIEKIAYQLAKLIEEVKVRRG